MLHLVYHLRLTGSIVYAEPNVETSYICINVYMIHYVIEYILRIYRAYIQYLAMFCVCMHAYVLVYSISLEAKFITIGVYKSLSSPFSTSAQLMFEYSVSAAPYREYERNWDCQWWWFVSFLCVYVWVCVFVHVCVRVHSRIQAYIQSGTHI